MISVVNGTPYIDYSAIPSDDYYIENCPRASIGRIPAETPQEVQNWLDKAIEQSHKYIEYENWKNTISMFTHNMDNPANGGRGYRFDNETDRLINAYLDNVDYAINYEFTADYQVPYYQVGVRGNVFENEINRGRGLVYTHGVGADWNFLIGFYSSSADETYCDWAFHNTGKYPLLLGQSCSIGKIQKAVDGDEFDTTMERLLFLSAAGIVGAIAPAYVTDDMCNHYFTDLLFTHLLYGTNESIGEELKRIKNELPHCRYMYDRVWQAKTTMLFGDPSMSWQLFQYANRAHPVYHDIDQDLVFPSKINEVVNPNVIDESTVWQGSIIVENPITVQSGDTLTIKSGTGIFFNPGASLKVYGHLKAQGTDAFPIVFGRADSASHDNMFWNGIMVYSPGSFDLDHTQINGARFGLYANYASGTITNSRFEEDYYGVYLYHTKGTALSANTLVNNRYGTYNSYTDIKLINNQYTDNVYGIMFSRSGGEMSGNTISGSQYDGIYCTNLSSPSLSTSRNDDGSHPAVNNSIMNNTRYGVYVSSNSTPDLGTYFHRPGAYYHGGFNHFAPAARGYDVKSDYGGTIGAQLNWWDALLVSGDVKTDPTANQVFGGLARTLALTEGLEDSLFAWIRTADSLSLDSAYSEAVSLLQAVIDAAPDDPLTDAAITRLGKLFVQLDNLPSFLDYLELLQEQYPDQRVGLTASDYLVTQYSETGDFMTALNQSEDVIATYEAEGNEEGAAWALYEQGLIYENIVISGAEGGKVLSPDELQAQAEASYGRLLREHPTTAAAYFLLEFRGVTSPPPEIALITPETYLLQPAYPNPFNPVTTLSYALPTDSHTQLVIYDLRGRVVRTLVNREETAGQKTIRWDGRNNQGIPVASGVYLYSLTANALNSDTRFTAHRKLVLLK
ncbi:MAG: C25 family cysteine peptidase [Fidelibacterota bacterium]